MEGGTPSWESGFGEVRLEVCLEEKKRRAVKRIWATGSTLKAQYERELKALLEFSKPKCKESAAFVEFYGWFQDPESVYIAMEFIPLGDLEANVTARGGALKEPEVRDITVQVLEGLKIMHLESFVHRDLKPKVSSEWCLKRNLIKYMTEYPRLSWLPSVVGQACRLRLEQTSHVRNSFRNFDRNASIHGTGDP